MRRTRDFMFEITNGDRTLFMSAESEKEMNEWLDVLQRARLFWTVSIPACLEDVRTTV